MDQRLQYKTALGLAKRTLDYIARYGTPPTPHAYEVFYTVCAGLNPQLNEALGRVIAEHRHVTAQDAERLYQKYLSPQQLSEQVENIGAQMTSEMSALLAMIGNAAASANTYQASLQNAEEQLSHGRGQQSSGDLVSALVNATKTMSKTNAEVCANLETSRAQVEQLEDCLKLAREESSRDPLTGLVNRRQLELSLDETIIRSSTTGQPASLLIIDVDEFKAFNDTHGHVAGDSALRYVASCIKSNIKGKDTAGRFGGEEFAVILPDTTIEHAVSLAERTRHLVNARHLVKKATGESMGHISVSVGVAECTPKDTVESFLLRADKSMYAAKKAGRNRVESAAPEEPVAEIDAA
ncbi:MAG: GGDEF domain-containing protein [Hyphomicrobiaceae bacterium]|nr:GGDEF domain-containing protein [Hyphomicrobiaceae bacterium]